MRHGTPELARIYLAIRAEWPNLPAAQALREARREALLRYEEHANHVRFNWIEDEDGEWVIDNLDPEIRKNARRRWVSGEWQIVCVNMGRAPFCQCCATCHELFGTDWTVGDSLSGIVLTSEDDPYRRQVERELAYKAGLFDGWNDLV